MKYAHIVIVILLVLSIAACGEGPGVPGWLTDTGPGTSCEEYGSLIGGFITGRYLIPEVLELRALRRDIVARATLLKDEVKVVDAEVASTLGDSIDVDTNAGWAYYSEYKYTLLHELELRVHEYLKGQGPDRITAIVASQNVSNSEAEIECAKSIYEDELSFEEGESVFFLEATDDPDKYYLGLASSITGLDRYSWSPLMPGTDGEFYLRERREWIALDEIRKRVSNAVQEYSRYEDADWQQCVMHKYAGKEWLGGRYSGLPLSLPYLPKQVFSFGGENVPVLAGAIIWEFPDTLWQDLNPPRLEGESAERFEITFHQDYEFGIDRYALYFRWEGAEVYGLNGVYSAKWTAVPGDTTAEWTLRQPGHTLTAAEDLPQGLYRFFINWQDPDARDCGQDPDLTEYLVVVTEPGGPSEPPPAPAIDLRLMDESNSIEISWENLPGVSKYVLSSVRHHVPYDHFKPLFEIQAPDDDTRELTWSADLLSLPCDMEYSFVVQARGDGRTYIDDWGQPSASAGIIVTPENMPCKPNHRRIHLYSGKLESGP